MSNLADGSSSSMASEASEDNLGNAVLVVPAAVGVVVEVGEGLVAVAAVVAGDEVEPKGERRAEVAEVAEVTEAAATTSSSLSMRLSLTRSDKLLTANNK